MITSKWVLSKLIKSDIHGGSLCQSISIHQVDGSQLSFMHRDEWIRCTIFGSGWLRGKGLQLDIPDIVLFQTILKHR
jgi:hypothetical protein